MAHQPVRIGILGAGAIGKIHARAFAGVQGAEIVTIADIRAEAAAAAAAETGVARSTGDPEAVLADPSLDAVIVGVPNRFHHPMALAALRAGKHVLLEKPMAMCADEARGIAREARASGKVLLIGHQMRWGSAPMAIHRHVASGALGDIHFAKATWWRRKAIPGWGSWFTRKAESGGGVLIDVGVHLLDLALWLMGGKTPVSVSGIARAVFGPERRGLGTWGTRDLAGFFDVEDMAAALVRFADGSALSLEASWATNMDGENGAMIRLYGDRAGIAHDNGKGSARLLREENDALADTDLEIPPADADERTLLARHFVDCIQNGTRPISDAASGVVNQAIIEGIYRSAETGREVPLDCAF